MKTKILTPVFLILLFQQSYASCPTSNLTSCPAATMEQYLCQRFQYISHSDNRAIMVDMAEVAAVYRDFYGDKRNDYSGINAWYVILKNGYEIPFSSTGNYAMNKFQSYHFFLKCHPQFLIK